MSDTEKESGKIEIAKVQQRAQIVREMETGRKMVGLVIEDVEGKSYLLIFSDDVAHAIHDALH